MKTIKVMIIDPIRGTVRLEDWDQDLQQIYKWIGTDCLDHFTTVTERNGVRGYGWCDDVGLYNPKLPKWFCPLLYTQPIAGVCVLFGGKVGDEDSCDIPFTVKEVMDNIRWGFLFNPHGPVAGSA